MTAAADKKTQTALRAMHPYGLTRRTLTTTFALKGEQLTGLVKNGMIVSHRTGCYELTSEGRKAAGIT